MGIEEVDLTGTVWDMRVLYVSIMSELEMEHFGRVWEQQMCLCVTRRRMYLFMAMVCTVECFGNLQVLCFVFPVLTVFPCPSPGLQPIASADKNSATEDRRI